MNKTMTIEWHDLIEDPTDLPPISDKSVVWSEEVYVHMKSGNRFNASYRRGLNEDEGGWYTEMLTKLNGEDIVAWTYIPRYRNKEKRIDDLLSKLPVGMIFHRIKKTNSMNVYPKPGVSVIIFKYDESKDSIVSAAGYYDMNKGWEASNRYSNLLIDDVIGWSPFFEVKEEAIDSDKEEE